MALTRGMAEDKKQSGKPLIQIGMGAGAVKNDFAVGNVNAVNKNPIRRNMTFPPPPIFSVQRVVFVSWEQRNFLYEHPHNIPKPGHIFTALFHQLDIFVERAGDFIVKHSLQTQYLVQIIK